MTRAAAARPGALAAAAAAVLLLSCAATGAWAQATAAAAPEPAAAALAPAPEPKCDRDCLNGGRCAMGRVRTYCSCPLGFTGGACELQGRVCSIADGEGNPAAASPTTPTSSPASSRRRRSLLQGGMPAAGPTVFCQNGGTCAVAEVPSPAGYAGGLVKKPVCDCSSAVGFGGRFCHLPSVRCPNPMSAVQECFNGGTCPAANARSGAVCSCPPGFSGKNCETDQNAAGGGSGGRDRHGNPLRSGSGARQAGWNGVGALTREQELALLAREGADVHGPDGDGSGLAGWEVALVAVGSALGAAAVAGGLLAACVVSKRREQDRLTQAHLEKRQRRGAVKGSGGGGNNTSGGGGRKAPLGDDEECQAAGPVSSPLATALRPPSRAADQF
jgi:hypothetical protein